MNLTAWVDVAIGLTLVYLGTSLFVTVINEYISQLLSLRGRQLRESLQALFGDEHIAKLLSDSPVLKPFFSAKGSVHAIYPAYVDPEILSRLLVGGLALGETTEASYQRVVESVNTLPESELKRQFQSLIATTGKTTQALVNAVSEWTEQSLTALGDHYRRFLRGISFVIGFVVAVGLNIDTVGLTAQLYRDNDLRGAVVAFAFQNDKMDQASLDNCRRLTEEKRQTDVSCTALIDLVDAIQNRNTSLGKLPIGWSDEAMRLPFWPSGLDKDQMWGWWTRLGGWLLTALALSLGAPFWFDLLSKVVDVRHGMANPKVEKQVEK